MKKQISIFFVIAILVAFASQCTVGPANISSLKFGNNGTADPPKTSFTVGEDIWLLMAVSNTSQPVKVKDTLIAENVPGVTKGQEVSSNTMDVPDARVVRINYFGINKPGEFKVEVTLSDNTGKVVDTKSATFTLNPKEPAASDGKPNYPPQIIPKSSPR